MDRTLGHSLTAGFLLVASNFDGPTAITVTSFLTPPTLPLMIGAQTSSCTAGCISIDQNRPTHTLALSFSLGMEPSNGADYTSFAMLT